MKRCTKCNTDKPFSEFAFKNKAKGRLSPACKVCHRLYSKQHYIKRTPYYIAKATKGRKKNYDKNRAYVDNYKSSNGCTYCPENDCCCLDFHHVGNKLFNVSREMSNRKLCDIIEEIKKCEVVCANCHRKLHAGRLGQPRC